MSDDSPKVEWSGERVDEEVGFGIPRQFPGRNGLSDELQIHHAAWQIKPLKEDSLEHWIVLKVTDQANRDARVLRMKPRRAAHFTAQDRTLRDVTIP